jgi:hypothetical protein
LPSIAALSAVAAAFAGDPQGRDDDAVTALQIATWLHDRRNVRIYDVRTQAAFQLFSIPTAERVTADSLSTMVFERADTVVIYGERDDVEAQRALRELRARKVPAAFILRGGVHEWVADVLNPVLPVNATAVQVAEFEKVSELSRYFGGVPRRAAPTDASANGNAAAGAGATDRQVEAVIRRGC